MGEEVRAIYVVGLACIYSNQARRGRGGCARFARQTLEALLFVVGYVYYDKRGRVALGRFENAGNLV